MNRLTLFLLLIFLSTTTISCGSNDRKTSRETSVASSEVMVYYFHFTRRCETCNAVESVVKASLKARYAKELQSGKIRFQSINLEEPGNRALAEKIGVSGQTLIVSGAGKPVDLTSIAFLNARQQPEKLEQALIKTLTPML